jgi:thioredoxin reductase (NADPH)
MASPLIDREVKLDPDDPLARMEQTFPQLSQEMASRIAAYGREEKVERGQLLYERGQRGIDFFLVIAGSIGVFDVDECGEQRTFISMEERQFLGELNLFHNRPSLFNARAAVDSRVVRVQRQEFQRLVSVEPDIGEVILRALILRRVGIIKHVFGGVVVVGSGRHGDSIRLQRFLTRNTYPHRMLDTDTDLDAAQFLAHFAIDVHDLPVVIAPGAKIIRNPSDTALAEELGLTEIFDPAQIFDVAIVGGGPAGLSAAVYAASEGLTAIVLEAGATGGQAATSSKIENYLGFPTGISGQALTGRAQVQAQKFGARFAVARAVVDLDCKAQPYKLRLDDNEIVAARAVVIASGARYRKLDVPNYERFEGQGIHYAATALEAQLCADKEAVLVGGGNSAGQAAMYLSRRVAHLYMLVRGNGLAATMSEYLITRIKSSPKITLLTRTEITALAGDTALRQITWRNRDTEAAETHAIENLFVMIGADPNTAWLSGCLALDSQGFVETGFGADGIPLESPFATTLPGVYAVGDVRSGSVKRIASGVGEGSIVIQALHRHLNPH